MTALQTFLSAMDWPSLFAALCSALSALLCLTVHELSHGLAAYALGDKTAKASGRLSLNPLRHIDWLGFLLMLTAGVGWAKPVPVDMSRFRHPKRDMALTALAGPISNFLLAWLFFLLSRLYWRFLHGLAALPLFFFRGGVLSVGLGLFNLIPFPPLDGSRVLFAFLPDKLYYTLMKYERFLMLALLAVVWLGLLDRPLNALIQRVSFFLLNLTAFI